MRRGQRNRLSHLPACRRLCGSDNRRGPVRLRAWPRHQLRTSQGGFKRATAPHITVKVRSRAERLALLATFVGLVIGGSASATMSVASPFPLNGSFDDGSRWWTTRGDAAIEGGVARIGSQGAGNPFCWSETALLGEVGAISSDPIPNLNFRTVSYRLTVASADFGDAFEVWAVGTTHSWLIDRRNFDIGPNCGVASGTLVAQMPAMVTHPDPAFRLEFRLMENGNMFHMRVVLHQVTLLVA